MVNGDMTTIKQQIVPAPPGCVPRNANVASFESVYATALFERTITGIRTVVLTQMYTRYRTRVPVRISFLNEVKTGEQVSFPNVLRRMQMHCRRTVGNPTVW